MRSARWFAHRVDFEEDEEEVMMKRACGMRLGKMVDEVERKRLMRAAG